MLIKVTSQPSTANGVSSGQIPAVAHMHLERYRSWLYAGLAVGEGSYSIAQKGAESSWYRPLIRLLIGARYATGLPWSRGTTFVGDMVDHPKFLETSVQHVSVAAMLISKRQQHHIRAESCHLTSRTGFPVDIVDYALS